MAEIDEDYRLDQEAKRSCDDLGRRLDDFVLLHRIAGTRLASEAVALGERCRSESAHIVAVWD